MNNTLLVAAAGLAAFWLWQRSRRKNAPATAYNAAVRDASTRGTLPAAFVYRPF